MEEWPTGTTADAQAIEHLREDAHLGPIVTSVGPRTLEPVEDTFRRLVWSIISQQVSTASARAIRQRLFDAVEITPEAILTVDDDVLRDVGLSRQKASYVRGIAEAYLEHEYDYAYFAGLEDEAVIDELTAIKGIGTWTAKMFLMFVLARPDVFPVEDLGIRTAMHAVVDPELSRSAMVDHADAWRPYRSTASLYLWEAIE